MFFLLQMLHANVGPYNIEKKTYFKNGKKELCVVG